MNKLQEHTNRLRTAVAEDLITGDDGFKVYWPEKSRGYLTAADLRIIAEYIDELNVPWQKELDEYMNAHKC